MKKYFLTIVFLIIVTFLFAQQEITFKNDTITVIVVDNIDSKTIKSIEYKIKNDIIETRVDMVSVPKKIIEINSLKKEINIESIEETTFNDGIINMLVDPENQIIKGKIKYLKEVIKIENTDYILFVNISTNTIESVNKKLQKESSKNSIVKDSIKDIFAISLNLTPAMTLFPTKQNFWNNKPSFGGLFGLDFTYYITEIVGIGFGVEYSYLNHRTIMKDNYSEIFDNITDNDGDISRVSYSYKGIKEEMKLHYFSIPFYVGVFKIGDSNKKNNRHITGYITFGGKVSFLMNGSKAFSGDGSYNSTGFYEKINGIETNVLLHDIDELNCYGNKNSYEDPVQNLNKFLFWLSLSGGIDIPFDKSGKQYSGIRIGPRIDWTQWLSPKNATSSSDGNYNYRINQNNTYNHAIIIGLNIKFNFFVK